MDKIFPYINNIDTYIGAYVKDPLKGENFYISRNVIDMDARSLYPSVMLNSGISPENILFLIPERVSTAYMILKDLYLSKYNRINPKDFINFLIENKDITIEFIKFVNINHKNLIVYPFNIIDDSYNEYLVKKYGVECIYIEEELYLKFNTPKDLLMWLIFEVDYKKHIITPVGLIFNGNNEGIIENILKTLLNNRNDVKNLLKNNKQDIGLKMLDWAYKLLANSMYGLMGFSKGILYNILIASSVTLIGQWFIKYISKKYNDFKMV